MGYTGINLENVKISNRSAILKLLNDQGAMSRKDIALELGLTPATVTLICSELLSRGILRERGEVEGEKRVGRKKVLIDINYQYRYVLSVSIEVVETSITISNLSGSRCYTNRMPTEGTIKPEVFLKKIADESKSLMWEHGVGKDMVLGVGVSVPGTVNRDMGLSLHAYRIWREPVNIGSILGGMLNLPVVVENNVKAFAEGELIYGNGKEQEDFLLIKWSPGVGSAIVIGNKLLEGKSFKNTEIGHCIVEKNGRACSCGKHGCLETYASTHAIAEAVKNACNEKTMPKLYNMVGGDITKIAARNIMQCIECDDDGIWEVLDGILELAAGIVMNAVAVIALGKIILYGQMFESEKLLHLFIKKCREYAPAIPDDYIIKSELSQRIEYIGPLAVAVNELLYHTGNTEE